METTRRAASLLLSGIGLSVIFGLCTPCLTAGASSGCDLNSDGIVNVADVQLAVNQAMATQPCTNGDLDGDGRCDVTDVQREINAALGGPCVTGSSGSGVCSVTSPSAASTQSGVVTWTANLSSLPSAASVDWIFDDFRTIGHVTSAPWSLVYNTGWNLDGPGNVKIVVRDGTGAPICTSADVPFTTRNFGMTVTINSPSNLQSMPTVSGELDIDISGSFPSDVIESSDAIDGIQSYAKISPGAASYPTGSTYRLRYDTTRMANGLHTFTWRSDCYASSKNCGSVATGGGYIPRIFVGAVINVQNGHTLMWPQPDVTMINMVVGGPPCSYGSVSPSGCGSYQLNPVLAYTDGTTASGTFRYVQDNACLFQENQNPQLPFQCVTGNTRATLNTSEGAAYVSVSPTGLIEARSQGESFISVIDTVSGKVSPPIIVTVKALATVPHFGSCGAIYTTYHAGGSCPSTIMTSLINADALNDANFQPLLKAAGYTAWEGQYHEPPQSYTSFSAWQSAWQSRFQNPINTALKNMPGMSMVLVGEALFRQPPDTIEAQQGPSISWSPSDPLTYELQQLAATNRIIFHTPRDEADAGLGFNLLYDYRMGHGLASITISGGTATFTTQGPLQMYGGWARFPGGSVVVQNATNPALNGSWMTNANGYYCTEWNAILEYNGGGSRDGDCAANPTHQ